MVGNCLLQGQLSVLTLIPVSVPLQWHIKDPGHSAKRAGGRLQLNMHAPCILCDFEWSDRKLVNGCVVYTELASRQQQFHMAPAMQLPKSAVKYAASVDIKNACYKMVQSLI